MGPQQEHLDEYQRFWVQVWLLTVQLSEGDACLGVPLPSSRNKEDLYLTSQEGRQRTDSAEKKPPWSGREEGNPHDWGCEPGCPASTVAPGSSGGHEALRSWV